jgi:hypothetical protein
VVHRRQGALRGTRETGKKLLASADHLALAQRQVDEKSNEIMTIPKVAMLKKLLC